VGGGTSTDEEGPCDISMKLSSQIESRELSPIKAALEERRIGDPANLDQVASPKSSAKPNREPISSSDSDRPARSGVAGVDRIDISNGDSTRAVVVIGEDVHTRRNGGGTNTLYPHTYSVWIGLI